MIQKLQEQEKAIALRKKGYSYREILEHVPVAKSTLSLWLGEVGLSKKQKQRITEKRLAAARRGGAKVHELKLARIKRIKEQAYGEAQRLIKDSQWIAGLVAYWAEGGKEKAWGKDAKMTFSNMDLEMHRLFMGWSKRFLGVAREDMYYELYIHEGTHVEYAKKFWAVNLFLPKDEIRVYYKKRNPHSVRKNNGAGYCGVLRIVLKRSGNLNRKVAGWIEGAIPLLSK